VDEPDNSGWTALHIAGRLSLSLIHRTSALTMWKSQPAQDMKILSDIWWALMQMSTQKMIKV
jgi:hypothetical protein